MTPEDPFDQTITQLRQSIQRLREAGAAFRALNEQLVQRELRRKQEEAEREAAKLIPTIKRWFNTTWNRWKR